MADSLDDIMEKMNETEKEYISLYSKCVSWLKANAKSIIITLSALIVGFGIGAVVSKAQKEIVTEKVVYVDNPKDIIDSKNIMVQNLGDMKATKSRIGKSIYTKEEIFGVYRSIETNEGYSVYLTIFEPVSKLRYNAKEYKEYKEKELKETKAK